VSLYGSFYRIKLSELHSAVEGEQEKKIMRKKKIFINNVQKKKRNCEIFAKAAAAAAVFLLHLCNFESVFF
jgi:hypothetical protein